MSTEIHKPDLELAKILFELYSPGTAVYALRQGRGYVPAEHPQTGEKLALTREAVETHVSNSQPIGVYPVAPGSDVTHFAVLDFDDHEGTGGWDLVRTKALAVGEGLKLQGISFLAFRSGGGKGIHLFLPFDSPVNAGALRTKLRSVLSEQGLRSGNGGVEKSEVEIFPKQDKVSPRSIGNLIALPLARKSVLLGDDFQPFGGDVLARLKGLVKTPASKIAAPLAQGETLTETPRVDVEGPLGPPEKHPLSQCEFFQHCIREPKAIEEPLWVAAATNAAQTTRGRAMFHYVSAQDADRYDRDVTDKKFDHAKELHPYTCKKISDIGYTCPRMEADGTCSITRGTTPTSFAIPVTRLVESLRRVNPASVRHRRISMVIKSRLVRDGAFFVAGTDQALLYFATTDRRLYRLDGEAFSAFLCDQFGLNSAEQEFKFILADIRTHALRYGVRREIFRVAHFSGKALYIDAGSQQMYRLDGASIDLLPNGEDGILFRDSERIEPFSFDGSLGTGHVRRYLADQLNTDDADLKDLLQVYIHSLYFEKLLPTKPIVLITGEKGSGKSFVGRAIKKALLGAKADVDIGITADEGSARAAFTHNYLVCMDNVDGMVEWLANLLASVSTGAVIRMRTLYKTNEESEFEPHCFVMLNSRDPASLRRDDIADRLLIFEVHRREVFAPESDLLRELADKRPAILSELLTNLNRVVAALKTERPALPGAQRLADFAALARVIGRVLDLPGAQRAIERMETRRNHLVLDGDPLVTRLLTYAVSRASHDWIATGPLFTELQRFGDLGRLTVRGFGRKLKNLESNLREHLTIEWRDGPHNTQEVRLTATPATRAAMGQKLGLGPIQGAGKEVKNLQEKEK